MPSVVFQTNYHLKLISNKELDKYSITDLVMETLQLHGWKVKKSGRKTLLVEC